MQQSIKFNVRKDPVAHKRFKDFKKALQKEKASKGQIKNYTWLGGRFIKTVNKNPAEWTDADFQQYFQQLVQEKRNYHYVNTSAAALRKASRIMAKQDRTRLIDALRKTALGQLNVHYTDHAVAKPLKESRAKSKAKRSKIILQGSLTKTQKVVNKTVKESLDFENLLMEAQGQVAKAQEQLKFRQEEVEILTRYKLLKEKQKEKLSA